MEEHSYGVIPLRKTGKFWEVLLVLHQAGHWSFPKGHPELHENEKQVAERELHEETGLKIAEWLPYPSLSEKYTFIRKSQPVKKTVTYFLAKVEGVLRLQQKEIHSAKWTSLQEAARIVTYNEARLICQRVEVLLEEGL